MLLNIYLGTTAVSCIVSLTTIKACEKRLERDGYKWVGGEKSLPEKVLGFMYFAFYISLPVYNILNSIFLICTWDRVYDKTKNSLLREGKIYKPIEEKLDSNFESQNLTHEKTDAYKESEKNTLSIEELKKITDKMSHEEKKVYLDNLYMEKFIYPRVALLQDIERLSNLQNLQQEKEKLDNLKQDILREIEKFSNLKQYIERLDNLNQTSKPEEEEFTNLTDSEVGKQITFNRRRK